MALVRLLIIFFAILPFFARAQYNYNAGYVINNNGDTLKGEIDDRDWYYNPDKISFKAAPGDSIIEITPYTSKEVTIAGIESFRSFEVSISMNSLQLDKLDQPVAGAPVIKRVFLKQLLNGNRLDLYSYTDKVKTRFYILNRNKEQPDELLYSAHLEDMQEQISYTYRNQLAQFAIDYGAYSKSLENKIEVVKYEEAGLKKIVSSINTRDENSILTSHQHRDASVFFAGMGIMQVVIKYTGQDLITADKLDANGNNKYKNVTTKNTTPRIVAGINFYSKKWPDRFSVKMELSAYHFASTIVSYTKYNNSTDAENQYTFHLSGWRFTITPQVIYKVYSNNVMKAYASAGPGICIATAGRNSMYKLGLNQQVTFNQTTNDYFPLRGINFIATARAGVLVFRDKVDIYLYGNTPVQYNSSNPSDFSVKSGTLAFCAAYVF